jgi:hypothetical protein
MQNPYLKELASLSTDTEKWEWLMYHRAKNFIVNLDNDETFVTIFNCPCDDGCCDNCQGAVIFDDYIGNSPGIASLLDAVDIRAELV